MNTDQNPSETSSNGNENQQKENSKSKATSSSYSCELPSTSEEDLSDLPQNLQSELTIKSSEGPQSKEILEETSSSNITKWILGLIGVLNRPKHFNSTQSHASTSHQEPTNSESEQVPAVRVFSRVSIRIEQESFPKPASEQSPTAAKELQQVPEVTNLLHQTRTVREPVPIVEQPRIHTETQELYISSTPLIESQSNTQLTLLGRADSHGPVPVPNIPPSYSTVIKFPPPEQRRQLPRIQTDSEFSFSTRVPPPSYSQVQGLWTESISTRSSEDIMYGPEPQYAACPNCSVVIVTEARSTVSKLTHFTALGLCLLGCWPCCLMPYFMASCKDTYHYCPLCNHCFGLYSPW